MQGPDMQEQTKSVLIIEDEKDIRDIYAFHLGTEYTVSTANNGDVPIETVKDADIVFCDLRMPKHSGEDFLKRIRKAGLEVPVVLISAVDETVQVDAEFQEFLVKPIGGETLKQCVEKYAAAKRPVTAD